MTPDDYVPRPLPRLLPEAGALYLADDADVLSGFGMSYLYDHAAQQWRRVTPSPAVVASFPSLLDEVRTTLRDAAARPVPPYVFAAIGAPANRPRCRCRYLGYSCDCEPVVTAREYDEARDWDEV